MTATNTAGGDTAMNDDREGRAQRDRLLDEAIAWTTQTPSSGTKMCHAQGKTAVYLSDDGRYIVEHPPNGPITRTPLPVRSQ